MKSSPACAYHDVEDTGDSLTLPRNSDTLTCFMKHVSEGRHPIHELSLILMQTIYDIETEVKKHDVTFQSPRAATGHKIYTSMIIILLLLVAVSLRVWKHS